MSIRSRFILAVVRCFTYLRHPRLIKRFVARAGYFPDPALPKRSTEKYLWRKLFDHDPRIVELTDKLAVKKYIQSKFPDIEVARVLWQGDDPADLPDELLRGNCVIKTNHGCGMNWFVRDGKIDRHAMEKQFTKWMQTQYGKRHREWAYSQIKPKLFVEEMLFNGDEPINRDYKFQMCGETLIYCYVCRDRFSGNMRHGILDANGDSKNMVLDLPSSESTYMPTPQNWDRLLAAARRLSLEFDHVRCDLFESEGRIWLSEFTFYSLAGYEWVDWPEALCRFSEYWDIRRSWFMKSKQKGWKRVYAKALREALAAQDTALN